MKFSFFRLIVKVSFYFALYWIGVYLFALNVWLAGGVALFFLGLLFFDLQSFRLKRLFNLFFLNSKNLEGKFEFDRDLLVLSKIHKRNLEILNDIREADLLDLDINSSIAKKDKLMFFFAELDDNLRVLDDFYGEYSVVAGIETENAKMAFLISLVSFIDIYLIGMLVSECSVFGIKLLDTKFNSVRSLVRSMIFPSTQFYIRSGFYLLRRLKFRNIRFRSFASDFVRDISSVKKIGSLPLMSTVKYYVSLFNLFKKRGVLPVQKNISILASKTKVREGRKAMSKDDVRKVLEVIEPGDIVLTRQASYLTALLIPGYWTHASLYMGDKMELKNMFGKDLKEKVTEENKILLEAIGDGVSASRAIDALLADSIIVLRPKVSNAEKQEAIEFVLENLNKEYNFAFDFTDEESFICSELVYKAYSDKANGGQSLGFEVKNILGNWTFTPQDIFDSFLGGNPNLEMVVCYLHDDHFRKAVMGEFKDLKDLK